MTIMITRKIINVDEDKCDGCGACVPSCAEGAINIIDGKAKLINETFCDGLGACLGECPQGAITIEERAAERFDEEAVNHHLEKRRLEQENLSRSCPAATVTKPLRREEKRAITNSEQSRSSELGHWPIQLTLVPPSAPFFQGSKLVLAADCVPFAYADFHRYFLKEHSLLVACPKLDDFPAHLEKLTEILRRSEVKSLTVVHMEVPCCSGLIHMTRQALKLSIKNIPLEEVTISIKGGILSQVNLTSSVESKCPG